jgi:type II secretory pathway component PulK
MQGVMTLRPLNNSGVILASALWIILILSLLAIGISRSSGIEASLVNFSVGKMKSYYAASAGIMYALNTILESSSAEPPRTADTLYQCGLKLNTDQDLKSLMTAVRVGDEELFDIRYTDPDGKDRLGFEDEERKINLNALNASNFPLLANLIVELGFSQSDANVIAASVIDWQDIDDDVTRQSDGAETPYYNRLPSPYACKNRPFDHVEELRLIKGVRPEIFQKLEPYVTVYPKHPPRLAINFNTASPLVVRAAVQYIAEHMAGLDAVNTDSLVDKMIRFRNGSDGTPMTADDQALVVSGNAQDALNLTTSENSLYQSVVQSYYAPLSNYFKIKVTGLERRFSTTSHLEAIIQKNPPVIVAWHRDL